MHREPRGSHAIDKIVIHVNQGPDTHGGARGLVSYLQHIAGGYHEVSDDTEAIVTAADDVVVWGASGMNQHGWHYCIIGDANQTAQQWDDPFSHAAVDLAARRCAPAAQRLAIPERWLTVSEVGTPGVKGFCTHADVSRAFNGSHYDPGPNFPKDRFIALVAAGGTPPQVQKVPYMFDPPLQLRGWTLFEHPKLGRCVAGVKEDGAVYCEPANAYVGGANGQPYFVGRKAARIEKPNTKEAAAGRCYTIIATSEERYSFGP